MVVRVGSGWIRPCGAEDSVKVEVMVVRIGCGMGWIRRCVKIDDLMK